MNNLKTLWAHLIAKASVLWKSATMWLAAVLAALPDMLTFAQQNITELVGQLPVALHDPVMRWIGLAVFLARLRSMVKVRRPAGIAA